MSTTSSSGVRVGLRVRPLLSNERHQGISVAPLDNTSLEFKGSQTFTYDYVFAMDVSQQELYNQTAAPLLKSFMEGYNITLIAYGQTGSGKTFTMGSSDEAATGDSDGLIPRFLVDLFENLQAASDEDNDARLQSWKVKASFLEIYGEDVYDLTAAATAPMCAPGMVMPGVPNFASAGLPNERPSLPVREDETGRVFVQGLHEIEVSTTQEAVAVLSQGSKNRITGATAMNAGSSRSHAVYTIQLEQTLQSSTSADDRHQMTSKLTFVDLAGSERLKRTGAEGQRLREGIQINSGLFNLGQVINALADSQRVKSGAKVGFVPYRNSKLTHLLKDALGGNSQTLFLACVSPAESNESETLSTLNYARQARNILNKPVVNMDKTQLELRQLKYAVKAWMMKAIGQKFGTSGGVLTLHAGAGAGDGSDHGQGLGQGQCVILNTPGLGLMSPLPCVSPIPTTNATTHGTHPRNHGNNGAGATTTMSSSSSSVANASGRGGFDDELSALLGRTEVQEYISAVNAAIVEKLAGGYLPSPRKVRLSALPGASPFRIAGMGVHMGGKASGAGRHGDKGLLGVAKKLALSGTGTGSGAGSGAGDNSWDDVPVGGNAKATGQGLGQGLGKAMPMIKEEVEGGGEGSASEELNSALSAGWLRTMNLGNLDNNVATTDPEETERLVTRMLEMINKEKAAAFEGSLSTDGLALVGGYAGEGGMGDGVGNDVVNGAAVASAQQEKAIQEMDLAIAEKEEILTKLLDTVRGYAAMKSDFERLLDSIGVLETERQHLEAELEKSKLTQASQQASANGQGTGPGSAAVERMKERFLKVKDELRTMRDERKNKENAYRLMQRESKQCDALTKELAKLKESKVAVQRQHRIQAQEMLKLKKDQQIMLTTMKKSEVKKQQLMNTLKSELVKRDRVLGHKDREIGRINSKLKACEEHISQLLKMQTRSRSQAQGRGVGGAMNNNSGNGICALSASEQEHLLSSKAMLDSLVGERAERRRNQVLFERKGAKLRELNRDLAQESSELEALALRRVELLKAEGKSENYCDSDLAHEDAMAEGQGLGDNHMYGEDDSDQDPRVARIAVQQQMRQVENNVDRITRELDLLNTDLEDLASCLGGTGGGDSTGAPSDPSAPPSSLLMSWEEIGKEVIGGLSLAQCNVLLWQQIGEKASLQEEVRLTGLSLQEASERVESAGLKADNMAMQCTTLRSEMHRKLMDAEKQRVQDVWALLKAQNTPLQPGEAGVFEVGVSATCDRVAMQRAQELEAELEVCLANEEQMVAENQALVARVAMLEAAALKASHLHALVRPSGGDREVDGEGATEGDEDTIQTAIDTPDTATSEFFEQLSCLWDQLGVASDERTETVEHIREAQRTARARALSQAQHDVCAHEARQQKLRQSLVAISEALGQSPVSFLPATAGVSSGATSSAAASAAAGGSGGGDSEEKNGLDLRHLPLLQRCTALQSAADAATAVMTVRSASLEQLKEQLLNTMSEMWLDANQLPECLKRVLQVDFHTATIAANAMSAADEQADYGSTCDRRKSLVAGGGVSGGGGAVCKQSGDDDDDFGDLSMDAAAMGDMNQAIASFMIHSAVALAEQLKKCGGLQLREEDMRKWERELRVLNVTRASLTTQLVAARKQAVDLCESLELLDTNSLQEIQSKHGDKSQAEKGSENSTKNGAKMSEKSGMVEQAENAAIALVVANSASNPPGSEPLLSAVRGLIKDLEEVKASRARIEQAARKLATLFHEVITNSNHPPSKEENTKDETLDTTSYPGLPPATASLRQWMDYLRLMSTHSALTKNSLTAKLTSLLTHILSSTHVSHASGGGGGGPPPVVMSASVRAEIAQEVEEKIAKILESAHSTGGSSAHTPIKVIEMEALLHQLQAAVAGPSMCKEAWLVGGVGLMESSWKTLKESQIPKSSPKIQAIVPSTAGTTAAAATITGVVLGVGVDVSNGSMAVKDTLRQVHVLFTEMARLTVVADTFRDLQKLDSQLVKHVREMEDFEMASKQDRAKLLSGNSRALIEEEKFRKNGKRKYEQITERIIAMAEMLEQLTATAAASSPGGSGSGGSNGSGNGSGFSDVTTTSSIPSSSASSSAAGQLHLDIGPLDLSSLSSQSQSVLKGKVQWQEKLELMHLHTTTHGTRRWSGGQPSNLTTNNPTTATTSGTSAGSKDSVGSASSNAASTSSSVGSSTAATATSTTIVSAIGTGSGVSSAINHPHTSSAQGLATASTTGASGTSAAMHGSTTSKTNIRTAAAATNHSTTSKPTHTSSKETVQGNPFAALNAGGGGGSLAGGASATGGLGSLGSMGGPALRPKDVVTHSNTERNKMAAAVVAAASTAAVGVSSKASSGAPPAATTTKKAVSFSATGGGSKDTTTNTSQLLAEKKENSNVNV